VEVFERVFAAELLHSGYAKFLYACKARFEPHKTFPTEFCELLKLAEGVESEFGKLVRHRTDRGGGVGTGCGDSEADVQMVDAFGVAPSLEPFHVWGGTSGDPRPIFDATQAEIVAFELYKQVNDWGGVDIFLAFKVKTSPSASALFVFNAQSKAGLANTLGEMVSISAAAASKLIDTAERAAITLKKPVIKNSAGVKPTWLDAPQGIQSSTLGAILRNPIAEGVAQVVLTTALITTKDVVAAPVDKNADFAVEPPANALVWVSPTQEEMTVETRDSKHDPGSGENEVFERRFVVWRVRATADARVARDLMTPEVKQVAKALRLSWAMEDEAAED